jgi:hypothetical protein
MWTCAGARPSCDAAHPALAFPCEGSLLHGQYLIDQRRDEDDDGTPSRGVVWTCAGARPSCDAAHPALAFPYEGSLLHGQYLIDQRRDEDDDGTPSRGVVWTCAGARSSCDAAHPALVHFCEACLLHDGTVYDDKDEAETRTTTGHRHGAWCGPAQGLVPPVTQPIPLSLFPTRGLCCMGST